MRVATPADASILLPLFEAFFGPHFEPASAEALARHLEAAASVDTVLLALIGDRAAGFASLRLIPQLESDPPHAELSDLFVTADDRRSGVGRALLGAAEDRARAAGADRIQLVAGTDNAGARAFYRSAGYEEYGVAMHRPLTG